MTTQRMGARDFHPLVWYMLVEIALARMAYFMAMPFVALRLDATSDASAGLIGLVVGVGPLFAILIGFFVGHLSDLWGRRRIILSAALLWSLVFLGFSFAKSPWMFALMMGLNGLAKGILEPVSAALISDLCNARDPSGEQQKSAFHLRYYAINIGASVGPLLGASLLLKWPAWGFRAAAAAYFLSAVFFGIFSVRWGVQTLEKAQKRPTHRFREVLRVLLQDRSLQMYLLAFCFIGVCYSQFDTTLALYLKRLFAAQGVTLFSRLLAFNGLVVVLTTIPILAWSKRVRLNTGCALSALVTAIGFVMLAFSSAPGHFWLAMALMTLGEIVVFANGYLLIESLAPEDMKGAYLGAANLSHAGVVLGPALGGILLATGGGPLLFLGMGALMCAAAGLYLLVQHKDT